MKWKWCIQVGVGVTPFMQSDIWIGVWEDLKIKHLGVFLFGKNKVLVLVYRTHFFIVVCLGNNYIWCKKFMCGTTKWAPGTAYFFIILLLPILTISVIGSVMGVIAAVILILLGLVILTASSILFFYIAAVDPGVNPCRRFTGHSKHCRYNKYNYSVIFHSKGFVQRGYLHYWADCFGMQAYDTVHCEEWGQCVREHYLHHPFFLKCIGQRNIHLYIWWVAVELFKNFFLLVISCAGCAFNIIAGVVFILLWMGMLTANVYVLWHVLSWVWVNRINEFQTEKQKRIDFFRYLKAIKFPPSKIQLINKIQQTTGIFTRSRDELLLGLSSKKQVKPTNVPESKDNSKTTDLTIRIQTDVSQDLLNPKNS